MRWSLRIGLPGFSDRGRFRSEAPLLLLIVESHQPHLVWTAMPGIDPGKTDALVFEDWAAWLLGQGKIFNHPVARFFLQPRHEVHLLFAPTAKQLVVVIATIVNDDRAGLQFKR